MAEVRRDVQIPSGPTTLLKQGHLELVAQYHVQTAFEYLQRRKFHSPLGEAVPVLSYPHS